MKRWKVTINRWETVVARNVEAETAEAAEEIALEWAGLEDDFDLENVDGGLNSVGAELEEC